jgi:hypothetical protein
MSTPFLPLQSHRPPNTPVLVLGRFAFFPFRLLAEPRKPKKQKEKKILLTVLVGRVTRAVYIIPSVFIIQPSSQRFNAPNWVITLPFGFFYVWYKTTSQLNKP